MARRGSQSIATLADASSHPDGDVITAVNGVPPFTDGYLSPGVFYLLYQSYPQQQTVRVTLRWPVTGATRTVTITPAAYPPVA
jgi:hypothetical protein